MVKDILGNSQRYFYSLRLGGTYPAPGIREDAALEKREVVDVPEDPDVRALSGYYLPREDRIREIYDPAGCPVLTFSQVLKYDLFPLPQLLADVLAMGQDGMGCPVELEFAVDLPREGGAPPGFALLQLRPMTAKAENVQVTIDPEESARAFCTSSQALGNGEKADLADIVFVKPDAFEVGRTLEVAREIGQLNAGLTAAGCRYLLIGPGRWGSADRWLGIPVSWADITSVSAMIETTAPDLKVDPSQGSHFFHNITTLDITYCTVNPDAGDRLDWEWLTAQPRVSETRFVAHVRLPRPFVIKADGRTSRCVMMAEER
jgi:hypothetical protein